MSEAAAPVVVQWVDSPQHSDRRYGLDARGRVVATEYYDYFDYDDGVRYCSLCDGAGHGYPGGGPCPLEETGERDVPWQFQ